MRLVIIGAGASYDSFYLDSAKNVESKIVWKPPLGKDLFNYTTEYNQILRLFPGAESFRSDIDACQDIEDYFQRKYELAKGQNGSNVALLG